MDEKSSAAKFFSNIVTSSPEYQIQFRVLKKNDQIAIEMRHPDSSEIFLENGVVIPKTNFSGVAINPSPTLQKQKELSRARRSKAEPKDIKKNGRTLRKANTERKRKKLFVPVICG
ncbi:unnamed protein product [Ceratitis capitata]|uniref:(Mediterranean fruit fly) hypothetical protein n=1 Tax=Ceratitis capitata TaxID=7213 RepID=A0A811VDQ0_CERCA|nr:unnamed protein product [Ceratitis capitata]